MQSLERHRTTEPTAAERSDERSKIVASSHTRELAPRYADLRRLELFRDLSELELQQLARAATEKTVAKNAYLFQRGDPGGSLVIMLHGVIEIVLEREDAQPLTLMTAEAGDFFGEMALFDGKPRSASARAICEARVLLIGRDELDARLMPRLATRVSAELARRLRRADGALAVLADRVSRAAHANANSAVAVELEAIKTLHRHTEHIAADALSRAEKRAAEVLDNADAIAAKVDRKLDAAWSTVKRRVAPLAALALAILGWFGVDSIRSLRQKLNEFEQSYAHIMAKNVEATALLESSKAELAKLSASYGRARALEETVGELRGVRDSVGLGRPIDSVERLRRAALNHEHAKAKIRYRYLAQTASGPRYEAFAANVVFEAVDLYVTLALGGGDDGQLWLTSAERSDLLGALTHSLASLDDVADTAQRSYAEQLFDLRARDMLAYVAADAIPGQRRQLIEELGSRFRSASTERSRENLALSLADLGAQPPDVVAILSEMQRSKRPARAAPAALALAKLGKSESFALLLNQLQREPEAAYPAATILAELGAENLQRLTRTLKTSDSLPALRESIEQVLRSRRPSNCLEERYARHLQACLRGPCDRLPPGEECPAYEALH